MRIRPASITQIFLLSFFVTTYLLLLSFYLDRRDEKPQTTTEIAITKSVESTEKVSRVIDGDTFEIEGGIKVRLIGVNTPEIKNKNKGIDCFATEAKKKMEQKLSNQKVVLVKDISETDKYGRLLRYVYLNGEMINDSLVREGYAKVSTFPPDVSFAETFLKSEATARESNLGLWQACN